MSIFYPRIQEEVTIRKNIALGPSGLGQYFSVLSPPLGFGGRIWIHYIIIYLNYPNILCFFRFKSEKKTSADLLLERPRTLYRDVPGPSLRTSGE